MEDRVKDLPKAILRRMMDHQLKQTGTSDVNVFMENKTATRPEGGFTWGYTSEGTSFWYEVLYLGRYDVFFSRYPDAEEV